MAEAQEEVDITISVYKDEYILIRAHIPNLKSKRRGIKSKLMGGYGDLAKNAQIDCDFQANSFTLMVTGDNVKEMGYGKIWKLSPSSLLHNIDPTNSYWETEDNFVRVYLKKDKLSDDWSPCVDKGEL